MDYFDKLFGFKNITDKRINQIRSEKKLDYQLQQSYSKCPHLVFDYLMNIRRLNRKLFVVTYSTNILKFSEKTKKNMDIIDSINSHIDFKDVCGTLDKAILYSKSINDLL